VKTTAKYLLITLLILAYSVGMIGVAVYNCHCSHNGQIVLLAQDDCSCHHEPVCCHDSRQSQTTEETHGCDIRYRLIHFDREVSVNIFVLNSYTIAKHLFLPESPIKTPAPSLAACYNYDPPPLENSPAPDIYYLAQLRL